MLALQSLRVCTTTCNSSSRSMGLLLWWALKCSYYIPSVLQVEPRLWRTAPYRDGLYTTMPQVLYDSPSQCSTDSCPLVCHTRAREVNTFLYQQCKRCGLTICDSNVIRMPALIRPGHASDDDLVQASWRRFSRDHCFAFEFSFDSLLDKDNQTETTWAELVERQCVLSFHKTWVVYLPQYTWSPYRKARCVGRRRLSSNAHPYNDKGTSALPSGVDWSEHGEIREQQSAR